MFRLPWSPQEITLLGRGRATPLTDMYAGAAWEERLEQGAPSPTACQSTGDSGESVEIGL